MGNRKTKSKADDVPELLNLGPVSRRWLAAVGVRSQRDLGQLGAAAAYVRVRDAGFKPSLNLLWALQGAVDGLHWTMVPPPVREALRKQVEAPPSPQRRRGSAQKYAEGKLD